MTLLLQLYANLPTCFPGHERRLYIFSCKRKACRRKDGSVRVVRATKGTARTQKEKDDAAINAQHKMDEMRRSEHDKQTTRELLDSGPRLGDSIFSSNFKTASDARQNPFARHGKQKPESPLDDHYHRPLANPFAPASTGGPIYNNMPPASAHINSSTPKEQASSPPKAQSEPQDLATTFAQKARINSPTTTQPTPHPKAPWPNESELPRAYPSYHLDADYETLDPTPPSSASASKPSNMEIDPTDSAIDVFDKEAFESTLDKTFQKFADRVAQNPEQVLRYEYSRQPLLYSITDAVGKIFHIPHPDENNMNGVKTTGTKPKGMPKCTNCGTARVFEVQLMPEAIAQLEVEEEGLDGMEWGTVIVGVCGKDCGERGVEKGNWGWVEEWCGVQWEEVVKTGRS